MTHKALVGVIGASLAASVGVSVALAGRLRKSQEELRICQNDFLVLEEKWSACRKELREARLLE